MAVTNRRLMKELLAETKGLRKDLQGLRVVTVRELTNAVSKELGKTARH